MFAADSQRFAIQSGRFAHISRCVRELPFSAAVGNGKARAAESGHAGRGAPPERRHAKRPGGRFAYHIYYQCVAYTNYVFCTFLPLCKLRARGVSYLCIVRGREADGEGSRRRWILYDFFYGPPRGGGTAAHGGSPATGQPAIQNKKGRPPSPED